MREFRTKEVSVKVLVFRCDQCGEECETDQTKCPPNWNTFTEDDGEGQFTSHFCSGGCTVRWMKRNFHHMGINNVTTVKLVPKAYIAKSYDPKAKRRRLSRPILMVPSTVQFSNWTE